MIQDTLDLRKQRWVERGPKKSELKTLAEIRGEAPKVRLTRLVSCDVLGVSTV